MKLSRRDIGTHILALVLALVLWFFVMYTQSPTGVVELNTRRLSAVTLEVRNRPVGLTLVHQPTAALAITLRGPRQVLEALRPQDVVAYLDLAGLQEGTHQLSVRVALPGGLEVVSTVPPRIEVALDQIISTAVPVQLALVGDVAAGYFAPLGEVTPSSIVVTGGRSAVARLAPLVIRLNASGLNASLSASAELLPLDAAGQPLANLSLSVASVQYHQPVYPTKVVPLRLEARGTVAGDIKDVRLETVASPEGLPLQATLAAPPAILQGVTELVLPVDVTGLTTGTILTVTPVAPLGAHLVAPLSLGVRVTVGPQ